MIDREAIGGGNEGLVGQRGVEGDLRGELIDHAGDGAALRAKDVAVVRHAPAHGERPILALVLLRDRRIDGPGRQGRDQSTDDEETRKVHWHNRLVANNAWGRGRREAIIFSGRAAPTGSTGGT